MKISRPRQQFERLQPKSIKTSYNTTNRIEEATDSMAEIEAGENTSDIEREDRPIQFVRCDQTASRGREFSGATLGMEVARPSLSPASYEPATNSLN
jgi:hypothetical protein